MRRMWRAQRVVVAVLALGFVVACGDSVVSNSPTTTSSGAGGNGQGGTTATGGSATGGNGLGGGPVTAAACFKDHHWPLDPDYDQFNPTVASHCRGTNHQDIEGVEKLVFLGDSVTEGTFPTGVAQFYRNQLAEKLKGVFPGLEVAECAVNGARVKDLLEGDKQIEDCFPGPEPKRTLVVMTLGGNDILSWASNDLPQEEAMQEADKVGDRFRKAIEWFFDDPAKFPAGVFVVFSNIYEYSDGTANLGSCPGANLLGLSGNYLHGATAVAKLEEIYMSIAVDTGADMIFMLEEFCGHGYERKEEGTCYLGPDAELWFDLTCIHPTPTGHSVLADMFFDTITY